MKSSNKEEPSVKVWWDKGILWMSPGDGQLATALSSLQALALLGLLKTQESHIKAQRKIDKQLGS